MTEDQETTGEVNSEEKDCKIRRKTDKGRRTSSVVRENIKETVDNVEKKMGPESFTEISNRCRKPSWPEENEGTEEKEKEEPTPVKEKIRR